MPRRTAEQHNDFEDELIEAALRDLLAPRPLPAHVRRRIVADLERRSTRGALRGRQAAAWVALAASLTLAVVWPPPGMAPRAPAGEPPSLSSEEAAEIVRAAETLSWDSALDYSLQTVRCSLEEIRRQLERDAGAARLLPWGSAEDWDAAPRRQENFRSGVPAGGGWVAAADGGMRMICRSGRLAGSIEV